jgi:hypothetical protein
VLPKGALNQRGRFVQTSLARQARRLGQAARQSSIRKHCCPFVALMHR